MDAGSFLEIPKAACSGVYALDKAFLSQNA
jgi:hypothetical protein